MIVNAVGAHAHAYSYGMNGVIASGAAGDHGHTGGVNISKTDTIYCIKF